MKANKRKKDRKTLVKIVPVKNYNKKNSTKFRAKLGMGGVIPLIMYRYGDRLLRVSLH